MSNLQQAIDKLRSSRYYKELAAYKPPFNPFEITGVTRRELTHSSVLAWLLRDKANKEFRQIFVTWIRDRIVAEAKKKGDHHKLQKLWEGLEVPENHEDSSLEPKIVRTEKGDKTSRIDVFAHFESLKLVIGIEVKVEAGEQLNQVTKYQKFLCQKYPDPGYKKVIVFLTPKGYPSETKSKHSDAYVLEMSWSDIAWMVRKMRSALGDENNFRMQFSRHLERNIAMNETEEQRIVRELLSEGDNAETLDKINNNWPSLQIYSAQWKKIVAGICDAKEESLEEETDTENGIVEELKIRIPEWKKAGLPFTLMLHKYQNHNAGVRVLLSQCDYSKARAKLKKFASCSNGVVNDKFPPVEDWDAWHSVLAKDETASEPEHTLIDDIWRKDWENNARERLYEQIKGSGLLDQINKWIKTKGANKG